jgi:hypothetical protein
LSNDSRTTTYFEENKLATRDIRERSGYVPPQIILSSFEWVRNRPKHFSKRLKFDLILLFCSENAMGVFQSFPQST